MSIVQELYEDNINFFNNMMRLAYTTLDEYSKLLSNMLKPVSSRQPAFGTKGGEVEIEGIQTKSSNYLSILYGLSEGDQSKAFDIYEIGKILGYETSEVDYIVETLSRSELISREKASGNISITPYGIMVINGDINVGYAPIH
ncbi:MAG: hypothetical protein ACRENT_08985 [Thermodesulfobacteriota bacterium]